MNSMERARSDTNVFRYNPREPRELQVVSSNLNNNRELVRSFQFDLCASDQVSQEEFFHKSGAKSLVQSVVEGYPATVFAYGQTGSGKTYSMSGNEEHFVNQRTARNEPATSTARSNDESDGLIPRSLSYLFGLLERAPADTKFLVRACYCEIYNEQVFDLLNPASGSLNVRWNDRSGFYVQNLLMVQCDSVEDVLAVLHEGHRNRRVGSHEMNKDSSRSHSIMTVYVDRIYTDSATVATKYGKISFVDLAGSERLKETKSTNTEESSNINKSLLTLGKVISALAAKTTNANFIPYRDSKLTKLLMDSLGGSSLTLMVGCISPSSSSLEDTLSTLNYATRAKNIQNKPAVQVDPMAQAISALRNENQQLRSENGYLKRQLSALSNGESVVRSSSNESLDSSGSAHRMLPPLDRKPSVTTSVATVNSPERSLVAEHLRNQVNHLQEENARLVHQYDHTTRRLKEIFQENQTLQAQLQELQDTSARRRPTEEVNGSPRRSGRPDAVSSSPDKTVAYLKQQVEQLRQREQDLMQALNRRNRRNAE